jgi:hypothetical protein
VKEVLSASAIVERLANILEDSVITDKEIEDLLTTVRQVMDIDTDIRA